MSLGVSNQLLVSAGADICHVDRKGETALFSAARQLRFEVCVTLIEIGCDVNCRDYCNRSVLDSLASRFRSYMPPDGAALIKLLISLGADLPSSIAPAEFARELSASGSVAGPELVLSALSTREQLRSHIMMTLDPLFPPCVTARDSHVVGSCVAAYCVGSFDQKLIQTMEQEVKEAAVHIRKRTSRRVMIPGRSPVDSLDSPVSAKSSAHTPPS